MSKKIAKMLDTCKVCASGVCCRDGVEMTMDEIKKIEATNPKVKKPWFELMDLNEDSEPGYTHSTIIRNNRCVFQDDNKRCLIYEVRPGYCSQFPLESGKVAEFYEELCDKKG